MHPGKFSPLTLAKATLLRKAFSTGISLVRYAVPAALLLI